VLTEDDRPSTPPTSEPTAITAESLAESHLPATPAEVQQILDEPAFRFAWGFDEDQNEEDFVVAWHFERAVLKIYIFSKTRVLGRTFLYVTDMGIDTAQTEARRQGREWKRLVKAELKKSSRKTAIAADFRKTRAERRAQHAPWVSEVPER
jgi:hypothetical protein